MSSPPTPDPATLRLMARLSQHLLQTEQEWLPRLARESLEMAGLDAVLQDPALRATSDRAFRATFLDGFAFSLAHPGQPVPAALNEAVREVARELILVGAEDVALAVYRAGQAQAFSLMVSSAFHVTRDPDELESLLTMSTWLIGDFVERTVLEVGEMMAEAREEILRSSRPELREAVAHVLDGTMTSQHAVEERLRYRLSQHHTALVLWIEDAKASVHDLDATVADLQRQPGSSLVVAPTPTTRWVWVGAEEARARETVRALPRRVGVRIAVGSAGKGVPGFRQGHRDALSAQRFASEHATTDAVVVYRDVALPALMMTDPVAADAFVSSVLGGLRFADERIRDAVRTFVDTCGSVRETSERLYTHRNTVMRRLAAGRELLPVELDQNASDVAAALSYLRWAADR